MSFLITQELYPSVGIQAKATLNGGRGGGDLYAMASRGIFLFILFKKVDKSDLKVLFRFVAVFVSLSVCLVVVIVVVVFVAFHRRLLPKSPDGQ